MPARPCQLRSYRWWPVALCGLVLTVAAAAQVSVREAPDGADPLQVVIEREPLVLRSPETYKVPLHLDPIKSVNVAAQVDGLVGSVDVTMGKPTQSQAEVLRLDSQDRKLQLERAKAALEAAQIASSAAEQGVARQLADANEKVAQLDVELAQYRLDQSIVRSPFAGLVQRVHVVEGQFVRAGEPLATVIDATSLQVEIPIDRASVNVGDQLQIQVEKETVTATVQGILPLTDPFEPLRDLFESVATGVAVVDNSSGRFQPGQTVYTSMIPRQPVSEIPNEAIGNTDEGTRRVQVIRDGFVRDVTIELLGAVGESRTVVTGRFNTGDELVVRSSEDLLDGTQVVPRSRLEAAPGAEAAGEQPRGTGPPPAKPRGF